MSTSQINVTNYESLRVRIYECNELRIPSGTNLRIYECNELRIPSGTNLRIYECNELRIPSGTNLRIYERNELRIGFAVRIYEFTNVTNVTNYESASPYESTNLRM